MGDIIAHFETGRYNRNTTFLEDAEYGRALDSFCKGARACQRRRSGTRCRGSSPDLHPQGAPQPHAPRPIAPRAAPRAGCADILLQDSGSGEVLLVRRTSHPQPDWWWTWRANQGVAQGRAAIQNEGGPAAEVTVGCVAARATRATAARFPANRGPIRPPRQAGDTPLAAARKNVLREAGLDLPTSSFKPLCVVSMLWQKRKQPPADNGTADVSVVYLAQVTPEERASVTLDAAEHAAARWVAPEAVAAGNEYHPALRR